MTRGKRILGKVTLGLGSVGLVGSLLFYAHVDHATQQTPQQVAVFKEISMRQTQQSQYLQHMPDCVNSQADVSYHCDSPSYVGINEQEVVGVAPVYRECSDLKQNFVGNNERLEALLRSDDFHIGEVKAESRKEGHLHSGLLFLLGGGLALAGSYLRKNEENSSSR